MEPIPQKRNIRNDLTLMEFIRDHLNYCTAIPFWQRKVCKNLMDMLINEYVKKHETELAPLETRGESK